jgi:hypothetical protein
MDTKLPAIEDLLLFEKEKDATRVFSIYMTILKIQHHLKDSSKYGSEHPLITHILPSAIKRLWSMTKARSIDVNYEDADHDYHVLSSALDKIEHWEATAKKHSRDSI